MKKKSILLFFLFVHAITFAQLPLIQWQKSFGGTNDDIAFDIKQTKDGGYITVGSSASQDGDVTGNHYSAQYPEDFWIVKSDACGTLQWEKSFGGTGRDIAYSVQQTTDKGYIVAGYTGSTDGDITTYHGGASDFWVIKLDTLGTVKWQKTLGGAGEDGAQAIQQTTDGGYIVAGWSSSNGDTAGDHDFDYWVVKLDTGGNVKWQKLYGGLYDDTPYDIKQTTDKGYIVAGYSESNDGDVTGHHGSTNNVDYWVIKIDSLGNLKWEKSYGGTQTDQANSIKQTTDGGYIVAGFTSSTNGDVIGNHGAFDYWVLKIDTLGAIQWKNCFGGTLNDQAYSIYQIADGDYVVAGITYSNNGQVTANHGGTDYWITDLNSAGIIQWQKTLGGSGADAASVIRQTIDGGIIVAGASSSTDDDITNPKGLSDFWIVKLNTVSGNTSICSGSSITLTASGANSYMWLPGAINSSSITVAPTSTSVYTLTASTGTCVVNSNTISILVNNLPVVTFTSLGFSDTLCSSNGSQNLTGGSPSGGTYSGSGITSNVFYPASLSPGTYTLTYSYADVNSCSNNASHSVTIKSCATTDITNFNSTKDFLIYPNPVINNVQVVTTTIIKKIILYDIIGNKIKTFSPAYNSKQATLDVIELETGIYFIQIYFADNTSIIKKIDKQ
ncbi:MAG: T9SS type A sorting domain-containing protein [Bacteroidia bacterium]